MGALIATFAGLSVDSEQTVHGTHRSPHRRQGVTRADALADKEHFDGKTTE